MTSPGVEIRPMVATPADLAAFRECFADNVSPRSEASLRWQYLDGPISDLYVELGVEDDEARNRVVSIYAGLAMPFQIQGIPAWGAQAMDVLTAKAHRGKGLLVRLGNSLYDRLAANGCAFIYGFPNDNSAPGFFRRLGWVSLDPVPILFRPLRTRHLLKRLPRIGGVLGSLPDISLSSSRTQALPARATIRPLDAFNEETDGLWKAFSAGIGVAVVRDQRYLTWRLREKPGVSYITLGYYDDQTLTAFVSYTIQPRHGGKVGYVMELVHNPASAADARLLLSHVVRELSRQGVDAAVAWNLEHSPNHPAFRSAGFWPLPRRMRPSALHFGVRVFSQPSTGVLANRRNWYLSLCDSDTD